MLLRISSCQLRQIPLDFDGNVRRIKDSILKSKLQGSCYRAGPELEIPGYGCDDYFKDCSIINCSWSALNDILEDESINDILFDVGMPVFFKNNLYSCRIFCFNKKILLICPKTFIRSQGNYIENRYFSEWDKLDRQLYNYRLPAGFKNSEQTYVPFGLAIINYNNKFKISSDSYHQPQELNAFLKTSENDESLTNELFENGVTIISNPAATFFSLQNFQKRHDRGIVSTREYGGAFLYSNIIGIDGGRSLFDGGAYIALNGKIIQGVDSFHDDDCYVVTAEINFSTIDNYRKSKNLFLSRTSFELIELNCNIESSNIQGCISTCEFKNKCRMEEIALSAGVWLWEYLQRSGAKGYFLPLSGGADSASVAAIVGCLTEKIAIQIAQGNTKTIEFFENLTGKKSTESCFPSSPKEIAKLILKTAYLGSNNSSSITRKNSMNLANEIGTRHYDLNINPIFESFICFGEKLFGKVPKFSSEGGTIVEDIALQNIQARIRMVLSYYINSSLKSHLLLGTGNSDECIAGYFTKYDCSSADINPISSLCKKDILNFLLWCSSKYPTLLDIRECKPSAELRPSIDSQTDETDMGITYDEIREFKYLRSVENCGPVSLFINMIKKHETENIKELATKTKRFLDRYRLNRHKMLTMTPGIMLDSTDTGRGDIRPFLYPDLNLQKNIIDEISNTDSKMLNIFTSDF